MGGLVWDYKIGSFPEFLPDSDVNRAGGDLSRIMEVGRFEVHQKISSMFFRRQIIDSHFDLKLVVSLVLEIICCCLFFVVWVLVVAV